MAYQWLHVMQKLIQALWSSSKAPREEQGSGRPWSRHKPGDGGLLRPRRWDLDKSGTQETQLCCYPFQAAKNGKHFPNFTVFTGNNEWIRGKPTGWLYRSWFRGENSLGTFIYLAHWHLTIICSSTFLSYANIIPYKEYSGLFQMYFFKKSAFPLVHTRSSTMRATNEIREQDRINAKYRCSYTNSSNIFFPSARKCSLNIMQRKYCTMRFVSK